MNERKGTTYISTSSCLRSEQKPLFKFFIIPTPKSGYLVALYSTHVVRLVGPPHLTKHLREEVLPDLQHLLLHARLHLTLLVHLRNRSPHLRHILLLLLILFPILWWLIQRAGAPTVPAPASTLAPFGLEDHQVPSNSL